MRIQVTIGGLLLLAGTGMANHLRRKSLLGSQANPPAVGAGTATVSSAFASGTGSKCGKGYTYCGYMLASGGHDISSDTLKKAYCAGADCNGGNKTAIDQALFVCMNSEPASISLLCACSDKCLNEASSSNIAHCENACSNSGSCF